MRFFWRKKICPHFFVVNCFCCHFFHLKKSIKFRLRDFLENYDDERDDRKFYFGSGSAFQRRLENRDKEKESDLRDRRKEEEEIGGLRKKLANEGHPGSHFFDFFFDFFFGTFKYIFISDPDGAIAKVIKEAEEVWKPFITPEVR